MDVVIVAACRTAIGKHGGVMGPSLPPIVASPALDEAPSTVKNHR